MFRNIKQKLFFSFLRFSIQPWYNETARTTSNLLCIAYFLLCHGTRPMCHSKQMRKGPRVIKQPNNRTGMKNWLFHSIFPVIYSSATECFNRVLLATGELLKVRLKWASRLVSFRIPILPGKPSDSIFVPSKENQLLYAPLPRVDDQSPTHKTSLWVESSLVLTIETGWDRARTRLYCLGRLGMYSGWWSLIFRKHVLVSYS